MESQPLTVKSLRSLLLPIGTDSYWRGILSIRDMTVDTFWKGEVRVQAVAEDGEGSYRTRIFIKNGEIYDYHCSCPYGSSYKGICEHGLELFKSTGSGSRK